MGFMSKIFKLICSFLLIFVLVLLGPSNLPDSAKFTEFSVAPTKDFGESLSDGDLLNTAERLFEGEVKGPEGFEVVNGELYTTLHGGYVAKVFEDQVIPVVKFGEPCEGWWEESKCGRPLGIKAQGDNHLIVADSYYGIFKYNIKTGKFTTLVDKDVVIEGKKPKIFNGVEVARDGAIYWTHSSSDFNIEDGVFAFLADGSGRLIKYDPATQKNTVLLSNLYFANGLILSPEEDYLLVSETGHSRILKFYLKGPKKFTNETFIDGLPGMPDNLRKSKVGYVIPLVVTRDESHPAAFQVIAPFPNVRKFAAQFLSLIELSLDKLQKIYPNYFVKRALHYVGHLESLSMLLPLKTTVLVVDFNGVIIKSYHGKDGSVTSVSDVIAHDGYLWLGSPVNNYLARIKLSQLGENYLEVTAKQTSTTPTPTTTTKPPPPSTVTTTKPPPPSTVTTTKPPPPSTITTAKPLSRTIKSSTAMPHSTPSTTTRVPPPKVSSSSRSSQPPSGREKLGP